MIKQGDGKVSLSYFEISAAMGSTKHAGGLVATEELIALCSIGEGKIVLDVGCGVGLTPCFVAKRYGSHVVGVDVLAGMIERSKEKAAREGVEEQVNFKVADAQELPFEEGTFDAVIGESVIAFVEEKGKAAREYVRVAKPGGYVGLNEMTWLKGPPPEVEGYYFRSTGARPEPAEGWQDLLEEAGLEEIEVRVYRFKPLREFIGGVRRLGIGEFIRVLWRTLALYTSSPAYRKYVKETEKPPKDIFEYLGYGIYVGVKQ